MARIENRANLGKMLEQNCVGKTRLSVRGSSMEVEEAARALRRSLTPAEQMLWSALRGRRLLGLKFRAQHPVGNYAPKGTPILDFYCPACRLVLEVDGGVHKTRQDYDHVRSQILAQYGYRELRFSNDEVLTSLPNVLARVAAVALADEPSGSEFPNAHPK